MQHASNQIGYLLDHTFFRRFGIDSERIVRTFAISKTYMCGKNYRANNARMMKRNAPALQLPA
jgi:hypothetical protein